MSTFERTFRKSAQNVAKSIRFSLFLDAISPLCETSLFRRENVALRCQKKATGKPYKHWRL